MSWKNIGTRNRTTSYGIVRTPESSHDVINIGTVLGATGTVIDVKSTLNLEGNDFDKNIGELFVDISNINLHLSRLDGSFALLDKDVSGNDVSNLQNTVTDLSNAVDNLDAKVIDLSSNLFNLDASFVSSIQIFNSSIDVNTNNISTNTSTIATHTTEISNLEGRINDYDNSLNSVQIWNKDSSNNISYSDGNVAIVNDPSINPYGYAFQFIRSRVDIDINIKDIIAGDGYFFTLFEDGKAYGIGYGSMLGTGDSVSHTSFQPITLLNNVVIDSISASEENTFFITNDGKVYGTGYNNNGQLGLGNLTDYNSPQLVSDISNLTIGSVSAGYRHTLFLTDDGKVYSCGLNDDGQLGLGNDISYNTPQLISDISNLTITAVSASADHSLFLTHDGRVYSCGGNSSGQLGLGNNTNFNTPQLITDISNITAITSGPYYTFLLGSNKRIYGVGLNTGGSLDNGIVGFHSHRLGLGTSDVSYNTFQQPDISNVDLIVSGASYSLLIANGDIYTFGEGSNGTGHGNTNTTSTPTKVTQNISGKIFKLGTVSPFADGGGTFYILSNDNLLYSFGAGYTSSPELLSYPDPKTIVPSSTVTMQLTDSSDNVLDISGTIQGRKFQGASNCEANGLGSVAFGTGTRIHSEGGLVAGTYNDNSGALFVVGNGTGSGARGDALTLDSSGNMNLAGDLTAFSTSDIRLKTNVTKIKDPLDKLGKINGYMYDWIENGDTPHKGRDVGVIAQEIEEILPELTITRDNGYKAVKYDKIVALLIECIKEQQTQIDALKQG